MVCGVDVCAWSLSMVCASTSARQMCSQAPAVLGKKLRSNLFSVTKKNPAWFFYLCFFCFHHLAFFFASGLPFCFMEGENIATPVGNKPNAATLTIGQYFLARVEW
jgi:Na+/melibiose symporter-like transporter